MKVLHSLLCAQLVVIAVPIFGCKHETQAFPAGGVLFVPQGLDPLQLGHVWRRHIHRAQNRRSSARSAIDNK